MKHHRLFPYPELIAAIILGLLMTCSCIKRQETMKVIIDNGHGQNTPGKCSPDRQLREYQWTRQLAHRLHDALLSHNIPATLLTPELTDTPLSERVRRANAIYQADRSAVLLSLHNNAAGADGQWHNARGFCPFVGLNASDSSKRLARLLYDEAASADLLGNRCPPPQKYWQQNLYILQRTHCPAVLTENLFQDNREDLRLLLSPEGQQQLLNIHLRAILAYYQP